jgi:hypothetical protein
MLVCFRFGLRSFTPIKSGRPWWLARARKRHYTFARRSRTGSPDPASDGLNVAQPIDLPGFTCLKPKRNGVPRPIGPWRGGRFRSLRLSVRTPPFHGGESGSIPLGSANHSLLAPKPREPMRVNEPAIVAGDELAGRSVESHPASRRDRPGIWHGLHQGRQCRPTGFAARCSGVLFDQAIRTRAIPHRGFQSSQCRKPPAAPA